MARLTPALEHTKQQLFKPFRTAQWTKLAFVGLLAGELGTNGFNRSNFQFSSHGGSAALSEFSGKGSIAITRSNPFYTPRHLIPTELSVQVLPVMHAARSSLSNTGPCVG